MPVQTNPSEAAPVSLNHPTETIGTHQASSPADMDEIRNSLKNQFPTSMVPGKELFDEVVELIFSHHKIKGSDYSSVLAELKGKIETLRNLATAHRSDGTDTGENQNRFKPLSSLQEKIMEKLDNNEIVKSLRVSYNFLDSVELRICLLLLAIFPENAVLKKRLLIYWWIGEGLVLNNEKGEEIFIDLLKLGFIMPHPIGNRPISMVNKCTIHPWIRYMLLSVAIKEKLLHIDKGTPRFDPKNSQRFCLIDDVTNLMSENGSETKDWRTIFNVSGRFLSVDSKWLANLKFVVLQLGRWQVNSPSHHIEVQDQSFLEGLRTQKHLKYLSLRGISRITTLPDSIKELVSLQILDLKACHNLETLPDAVTSLKKLTHLDVSECYLLESMPKGLEKLTSLQVLKGFIKGNSHKTPTRIGHLQKLENLKRLSIHIGSEAANLNDEFGKLKELKNVKCLKISWGVSSTDLMKDVSFPPELEKLDLEGFPDEHMPECLHQLSQLKKLYIKGGNLKKLEVPSNVEILILKYTEKLEINEEDVRLLFPSLKYVKKVNKKEDDM